MKLFLIQLKTKKKRRLLDVLVYARSKKGALAHMAKRYSESEVLRTIELPGDAMKHFVVGEWD